MWQASRCPSGLKHVPGLLLRGRASHSATVDLPTVLGLNLLLVGFVLVWVPRLLSRSINLGLRQAPLLASGVNFKRGFNLKQTASQKLHLDHGLDAQATSSCCFSDTP